jgi:hypothetical protein
MFKGWNEMEGLKTEFGKKFWEDLKQKKEDPSSNPTGLVDFIRSTFDKKEDKKENKNKENKHSGITTKASNEMEQCSICLENKKDCLYHPCNHITNCFKCATKILENNKKECPICRKEIDYFEQVFI